MGNKNLNQARRARKDEFYTQYADIQKEVETYFDYNPDVFRGKTVLLPCDDPEWSNFTKYFVDNFTRFGLRKLASTCHTPSGRGKILTVTADNLDDFEFDYLEGDGDFRSVEVKALRDEANIIVTNPPFSLFREFLAWIVEADKQFLVIGNMNAITYKEVFPLIKANRIWLGSGSHISPYFYVPEDFTYAPTYKGDREIDGRRVCQVPAVSWFTNLDHGRQHEPLSLMTEAENVESGRGVKGTGYKKYDNYDAVEVPVVKAIPSDYDGVMGVPITFLDKYNPDQFEILGITENGADAPVAFLRIPDKPKYDRPYLRGQRIYARILIKHRRRTCPPGNSWNSNGQPKHPKQYSEGDPCPPREPTPGLPPTP